MKCPKCQYISYDSGPRCRNCGYELSLTQQPGDPELPIRTGDEPIGPFRELPLSPVPERGSRPTPARATTPNKPRQPHRRSRTDLPLFKEKTAPIDAPLVSAPAAPRPPLAVRRAQPVAPRQGSAPDPPESAAAIDPILLAAPMDGGVSTPEVHPAAGVGRRAIAAGVDALLLAALNLGVLYLTLKIVGFSGAEILLLPPVPLLTFLALLDGGYLAAFTAAGGQTLGKMATGIKVVDGRADAPLRPLRAILRSAAYVASALPAGMGFLLVLVSADGRALHDRLVDTRVVRA